VFWYSNSDRFLEVLARVAPGSGTKGRDRRYRMLADLGDITPGFVLPERVEAISRGNLNTVLARSVADLVGRNGYENVCLFLDGTRTSIDDSRSVLRYFKLLYEMLSRDNLDGCAVRCAVIGGRQPDDPLWLEKKILEPDPAFVGYLQAKYPTVNPRRREALLRSLQWKPGFDDRLEITGHTLWLFQTDSLAETGLASLARSNIKVPARLSVISLENDPGFLHLGLSVCAPDWERAGYLMAHAVVGDFDPARTDSGYLRLPCLFVPRFTTPEQVL